MVLLGRSGRLAYQGGFSILGSMQQARSHPLQWLMPVLLSRQDHNRLAFYKSQGIESCDSQCAWYAGLHSTGQVRHWFPRGLLLSAAAAAERVHARPGAHSACRGRPAGAPVTGHNLDCAYTTSGPFQIISWTNVRLLSTPLSYYHNVVKTTSTSWQDAVLAKQRPAHVREVLAPKLAGAARLAACSAGAPLEACALFSSVAGLLGSAGQASYAAANAALDAWAGGQHAQVRMCFHTCRSAACSTSHAALDALASMHRSKVCMRCSAASVWLT